jgi:hypothetical protein
MVIVAPDPTRQSVHVLSAGVAAKMIAVNKVNIAG